jgi:hypothetical protein
MATSKLVMGMSDNALGVARGLWKLRTGETAGKIGDPINK